MPYSVFRDCATFMKEASEWGFLTRQWRKTVIADTIGGYLAATHGLKKLLKARSWNSSKASN